METSFDKWIHPVQEGAVARPGPQEVDGDGELRCLVGIALVAVEAVIDRAVGEYLVNYLTRASVDGLADFPNCL